MNIKEHKLSYQQYYRRWHKDTPEHYEEMCQFNHALYGRFIEKLPRGAALDMGCGMGFTMKYLESKGFQPVYGFDSDEEQISTSKKNNLKVFQADHIDQVFDQIPEKLVLVTAFDILEHMPPLVALENLKKIYAALAPGGMLICTVPNANSALAERWRYGDFTHYTSFTEHSLDFLLYNAGFQNITIYSADVEFKRRPSFIYSSHKKWLRWMQFKMARAFRRWQMVAELGDEAKNIPLSLNLLGVVTK